MQGGKLYSYTFMSLDGVMSSPETWTSPFFSDEMAEDLTRRLQSSAAMVLGRHTYAEFAEFWPRQSSDVPFADLNNRIRKYVVSSTLDHADWRNSSVIGADDLTLLKAGGDLHISGSGVLVRSLLERRLLDEMVIMMCPVVRGQGQRLFDAARATDLDLLTVTPLPRGVLCLTYRPAP
jgi:dihydrofolate reductase